MTCNDCYFYECHKHWYDGWDNFDLIYNKEGVEHLCPVFKDKSTVIEKPDTVFQTDGVRIYKSKVKNVIFDTDGIAFDERAIGNSVFLYEDQAEKALEVLKMKSEWKITSNYIGEEKMYAVYRLRDINLVDHSGNREYASDYMADRKEAEALANKLNKEGKV